MIDTDKLTRQITLTPPGVTTRVKGFLVEAAGTPIVVYAQIEALGGTEQNKKLGTVQMGTFHISLRYDPAIAQIDKSWNLADDNGNHHQILYALVGAPTSAITLETKLIK